MSYTEGFKPSKHYFLVLCEVLSPSVVGLLQHQGTAKHIQTSIVCLMELNLPREKAGPTNELGRLT